MASLWPLWQLLLFLIGAYLLGSLPTAYLAGRWLRGVDVREYGSGNVGGNNAGAVIGLWALVVVGLIDIGKAALPAWLALGPLDLGTGPAVLAGLCATAGHDWSLFLHFSGGRGVSGVLGTLVVVFPWGAAFLLLALFVGWRLKNTAGSSVGLLGLPPLSLALGMAPAVTWGCLAMIVVTSLKRLEANGRPLPRGEARWGVIWRRLWLDRDIDDHQAWLARRPGEGEGIGQGLQD
ncbi:MAG: glycerol-3-phosphate acyltransferase [Chloroflexota bacterium]